MNIGDGDTKLNGLTYLKDYIYEEMGVTIEDVVSLRLEEIFDVPFLLELQRFTATGNFDRISNALLAMYEFKKDEALKRYTMFKKSNTKSTFMNSLTRR